MMKYVYFFGSGTAEGSTALRDILGGKGANLHEMTKLGIPVPPGFTISSEVCLDFYKEGKKFPKSLKQKVEENIHKIEKAIGQKFGDPDNPLLVSVRSGARVSMPGMMDTVLNIGLNDETVQGLIKRTGAKRFAYDCYRRLVQMYGDVVMGVSSDKFEALLNEKKRESGARTDTDLTAEQLKQLVHLFKQKIKDETDKDFPESPDEQLWGAISAVFLSWNNPRAIEYRKINKIPEEWGTAVNVQAMVYGNMGPGSATGVAFTRNPATGENCFFGEYLKNAQGEDVVAGIRTPHPINIAQKEDGDLPSLEEEMPDIYMLLVDMRDILEKHYKDVQDIEFTVERDRLWLLQTRAGKRTPLAAVKIAVDMANEGLISREEAVMRIKPEDVDHLLHPMIDPDIDVDVLAKGLPASPGAVSGKVVFTPADAVKAKEKDEKTILVRFETSPEDIAGMAACEGVLTQRGGMTSHAAVVARGMGKPCIVGCESISIDYKKEEFSVNSRAIKQGDVITIDGATGRVIDGDVPKIRASTTGELGELLAFADEIRYLGVRTNADTPGDARTAREFGAEGIGLCRTEHMFFGKDRIRAMRAMILADNTKGRKKALDKLLPMQRKDFIEIFKEMDGLPVIIRTLDPPLHEFLPRSYASLIKGVDISLDDLKSKIEGLQEVNPMMGHRGCRLGISYPEVTEMQARAIFEAACEVKKEGGNPLPGVMIPLVGVREELKEQREIVDRVANEVMEEYGVQIEYKVGTMIEIPRAAITADEIAEVADFFSFGTNDLTQFTFGFSRDDVGKILPSYIEKGILKYDPFQRIDEEGVGSVIELGVERGREVKPDLEVGICGEHGGDPDSIEFCHEIDLNYVSCSPYRVPIARLAAAQAAIKEKLRRRRRRR